MFGGEGLNLATLEGDGKVILQSMTYEGHGPGAAAVHGRATAPTQQLQRRPGHILGGMGTETAGSALNRPSVLPLPQLEGARHGISRQGEGK